MPYTLPARPRAQGRKRTVGNAIVGGGTGSHSNSIDPENAAKA